MGSLECVQFPTTSCILLTYFLAVYSRSKSSKVQDASAPKVSTMLHLVYLTFSLAFSEYMMNLMQHHRCEIYPYLNCRTFQDMHEARCTGCISPRFYKENLRIYTLNLENGDRGYIIRVFRDRSDASRHVACLRCSGRYPGPRGC